MDWSGIVEIRIKFLSLLELIIKLCKVHIANKYLDWKQFNQLYPHFVSKAEIVNDFIERPVTWLKHISPSTPRSYQTCH